ncbi:peptidase S8 and S53, subtilisin, kexin, sedolisin, partial [Candidatus Thiomargarita nelsonii]
MNNVPIDENKWLRSWVFVVACVITGLITQMVALPAFAVDASKPETVIRVPRLIDKAMQQGTVRVIVGLNIPFTPEGQLAAPQARENQHQTIATTQNVVWQKMARFHARLIAKFKYIPFMTLRVDAEALKQLAQVAEVRSITEDVPVPLIMESSNGVIGSNEAWAMGYTGAGQTVAILDTGVDKTHPFFSTANKVVSEACYSTNDAFYTSMSACPSGVEESTAPDSGIDCTAVANDLGLADAAADCAHGTHVAGSAAGNDGIGPNFGVAKDAEVIAVQVFSIFSDPSICGTSGSCALSWNTDQMKGLERIFELHSTFDIAAVNMSLGGGQYFTFCDTQVQKAAIANVPIAISQKHTMPLMTKR